MGLTSPSISKGHHEQNHDRKFLQVSALGESLDDLIKGPVDSLIGVTTNAKAALENIGIKSIFDLAFSEIFKYAELINSSSVSVFQKANQFPSNLFDDDAVDNIAFTLGSLIKCIPLGPGEITKIAVIDWQRTTSGSTTENITQTEGLSNEMQQKRAINEVAEATAKESQDGFSGTGAVSTTSNVKADEFHFLIHRNARVVRPHPVEHDSHFSGVQRPETLLCKCLRSIDGFAHHIIINVRS